MRSLFHSFEKLETVDSTNDYLKQFIGSGRPCAVIARRQTAGRGRHGRSWDSPAGEGLYLSYLLFPPISTELAPALNQAAALAVAVTIESLEGAPPRGVSIKPPNDILVAGRKVGGILMELASQGSLLSWAIIGIGVNLSQQEFHLQRRNLEPTSLSLEGIQTPTPEFFAKRLTLRFESFYCDLEKGAAERIQVEFQKRARRDSLQEQE